MNGHALLPLLAERESGRIVDTRELLGAEKHIVAKALLRCWVQNWWQSSGCLTSTIQKWRNEQSNFISNSMDYLLPEAGFFGIILGLFSNFLFNSYLKYTLWFGGILGSASSANFPSPWPAMLALHHDCSTASFPTLQKVLSNWKLVELKMLVFSDCRKLIFPC